MTTNADSRGASDLCDQLGQMPTSAEDDAVLMSRLSKDPAEVYARGFMDGHAKGAATERERCAKLCESMRPEYGPHAYAFEIRKGLGKASDAAAPDMRHPKIQALIGAKARREIELQLVEQLLDEGPDCDVSAVGMEYWYGLHDKLRDRLSAATAPAADAQAVAWRARRKNRFTGEWGPWAECPHDMQETVNSESVADEWEIQSLYLRAI